MASHDTWQVAAVRPGRCNPAVPFVRPGPPSRQSVGANVANAVSRSVVHSSPSHSLALQLIMIE